MISWLIILNTWRYAHISTYIFTFWSIPDHIMLSTFITIVYATFHPTISSFKPMRYIHELEWILYSWFRFGKTIWYLLCFKPYRCDPLMIPCNFSLMEIIVYNKLRKCKHVAHFRLSSKVKCNNATMVNAMLRSQAHWKINLHFKNSPCTCYHPMTT